jgi:hypothetical protein
MCIAFSLSAACGLIVMAAHTRYALILCGVTKPVLNRFRELFADDLEGTLYSCARLMMPISDISER